MERLMHLAEAARYDVCLASCNENPSGKRGRSPAPEDPSRWIFPVSVPGKGKVSMLKVLQTNSCRNHCRYCAFSSDNDAIRRTRLLPHELAEIFMCFVRKDKVHGLFLSSGIRENSDQSMEEMLKTVEILRFRYRFTGYIHLKVLPACSQDLMERALQLSNRVSLNLESATVRGLEKIAPEKEMKSDLLKRMHWAGQAIAQGRVPTRSQTTQFVVGPSGEKDRDILRTVDWVYRELHVFRSYFSAYQRSHKKAPPSEPGALLREHRLYQTDFLLRTYGFRLPDLVFDAQGQIPQHVDPKQAFALKNRHLYPIEVNQADRLSLLKVPGIGPVSAERILEVRKEQPIREMRVLKKLGVICGRAEPWILLAGKRPVTSQSAREQWLFPELNPDSWSNGVVPLGKENSDNRYLYPGQQGKLANYPLHRGIAPVPCR